MKKILSPLNWLIAAALTLVACDSFLKEDPKTFLNPESYYQNEKQALAAVNGVYTGSTHLNFQQL